MQAIMQRMSNPSTGFLAYLTGSTVTLTELIKDGSVWVIFGGLVLSAMGGIWTYRTARVKFQIEMTKLKQAELEFERANGLYNGDPVKKHRHTHDKRG